MSRKKLLSVGLAFVIIMSAAWMITGCGHGSSSFEHGGRSRSYELHVPAGYDGATPMPLVVALHQFTDTARGMERLTDFNAIADREGFFVLYPDGVRRSWNAGRGSGIDDVGYIVSLVGLIQSEYRIDPERIYATGASAGGMMAQYLACQTTLFAAIAPVMGSMTVANAHECESEGIPTLLIHGTEDPVVPFGGGETFAGPGNRVNFFSAPENAAFWAERNDCDQEAERLALPDTAPDDGTTINVVRYGGCSGSNDVVLYEIEGGGHTWPGHKNGYPAFIIGRTSWDLDASEVIWEFFASQGSL
jgi:polyhydroxybutyrate depolymerase